MPYGAPYICGCGHWVAFNARCACQQQADRERKSRHDANRASPRDRGYDPRWKVERAAFLKSNPRCVRCNAPATVVDHIIPHKGNVALMRNRSNWQSLCTTCHSRWKQARERNPHSGALQ